VSTVIARFPLMIALIRFTGTRIVRPLIQTDSDLIEFVPQQCPK
jgi:hypothetical protein